MNPADIAVSHPTPAELVATILFGIAILHTFSVKRFEVMAHRYPSGSIGENLLHVLAEVEVVFGLWAGLFIGVLSFLHGKEFVVGYLEGRNATYTLEFTEPAFVFAIMAVAATRPVIQLATRVIAALARLIPLPDALSFFGVALIVGPLLGSFITEPAAMTVTALVLKRRYYDRGMTNRLMYGTLGVLFVNVSIGGTLSNFAAPPVLMVASTWGFDNAHMIGHFGWKAATAVFINTIGLCAIFGRELVSMGEREADFDEGSLFAAPEERPPVPMWLVLLHCLFLAGVVLNSHHIVVFMGIFLFFLGVVAVTEEHQDRLQLREALLVGFFLGGLVTLGGFQKWWLKPLIGSLGEVQLFLGATSLTAVTDNAALTYLGSLVDGITDASKFALLAGAVAGGGLTVIANAPNPAGYGILRPSFGEDGISPLGLLLAALPATLVAMACLWFLPSAW
ncbi:MAG: putative Na+/H+ antiporter [Deltaproteobacteria bacterium]|nr:putative Na+/H+ antiporter [Deltaproteobacteria bacterium]MCB9786237.1 putative Na+/H+ antiporter [Deltaproteobacteria bacterium]